MIVSTGKFPPNAAVGYESDPRCEGCGRSLVTRFGSGELPPAECPSCEADFYRDAKAGKLTDEDGNVWRFTQTG